MKFFALFLLVLTSLTSRAAEVDTVEIYSNTMHRSFKAVVIKPESYQRASSSLPVVYLLHGWSGNYSNWITKVPILRDIADDYKMLIVCPDGHYSSWYFDSPIDSSMRYETYIGKEVPEYIEKHYRVLTTAKGKAITGLSMGGHGALFIALHHPGTFGAVGSMSGAVDLTTLTNKYDILKRLGDTTRLDTWKSHSVIHMVENYNRKDSILMIIDCGTEDFFYKDNHALHEKMLKLGIPHEYIERPGKHDWKYWGDSVEYQLLFFAKYFNRDIYH